PTLVVDEAHQLEDVATQYFGFTVGSHRMEDFVRDAQRVAWDLGRGHASTQREGLQRAVMRVGDRARTFFAAIARTRGVASIGTDWRARYTADAIADVTEDGLALLGA